jgi:hypothetical protein
MTLVGSLARALSNLEPRPARETFRPSPSRLQLGLRSELQRLVQRLVQRLTVQ